MNASEAYRKAGYKNDNVGTVKNNSSKLLANTYIQEYIAERQAKLQEKTEITQEMIIKELAVIAFQDRTNIAKVVEKVIIDEEGVETKYKYVDVEETKNLKEDDKKIIAGIKQGKNGIEVSTFDKMKALELLGKHLGMFEEKQQPQQQPIINISLKGVSNGKAD